MPRPTKKEKTCPNCGNDGSGNSGPSVFGIYQRYGNKYQRIGWYCGKCKTYWYD